MRAIIEVRRLCHFNVPRVFCRLRISTTVAFKFIDNLALTQKMPLAVADVALDMSEIIEEVRPFHAP